MTLSAHTNNFVAEPSPGRVRVSGDITIRNDGAADVAVTKVNWDADMSLSLANIGGGAGDVNFDPPLVLVPGGEQVINVACAAGAKKENFQEPATFKLDVTVDVQNDAPKVFRFSSGSGPGGATQPLVFETRE